MASEKFTSSVLFDSFVECSRLLRGRVTKHHRFLLGLHLNQIDALNAVMATIDPQVEANLESVG
jgi:hypothetical protein